MKNYRLILIVGIIEILIGSITLFGVFSSLFLGVNTKPLNVLLFVIVTGAASTAIGIGILRVNKLAYKLLVYFSEFIVLSKFFMFMGIIELTGALETAVPSVIKDGISVIYHLAVIYFFRQSRIKKIFHA